MGEAKMFQNLCVSHNDSKKLATRGAFRNQLNTSDGVFKCSDVKFKALDYFHKTSSFLDIVWVIDYDVDSTPSASSTKQLRWFTRKQSSCIL